MPATSPLATALPLLCPLAPAPLAAILCCHPSSRYQPLLWSPCRAPCCHPPGYHPRYCRSPGRRTWSYHPTLAVNPFAAPIAYCPPPCCYYLLLPSHLTVHLLTAHLITFHPLLPSSFASIPSYCPYLWFLHIVVLLRSILCYLPFYFAYTYALHVASLFFVLSFVIFLYRSMTYIP